MPRRLGEDPLARARNERAKAAAASATVGSESGAEGGLSQPGFQFSSHAPYNDVFYQIRAEGGDVAIPGTSEQAAGGGKAQEISEISEIPEIREVATLPDAQANQDVEAFKEGERAPENAGGAEVLPPSAPVTVENPEAVKPTEQVAQLVADVGVVTGTKEPTDPGVGSQTSNLGEDVLEPEQKDGGGFIKRFFDRLGK